MQRKLIIGQSQSPASACAGVSQAVANINEIISPALIGMNPAEQKLIDDKMVQDLDGSKNEWGHSTS